MKLTKSQLKEIIKEEFFKEEHTITFSKEEMGKLHNDGKLEKDGHTYLYKEQAGNLFFEAKETIFDVAKRVVKNHQAEKWKGRTGKFMLDAQSANLLMKVYKKVNSRMKKILSDLGDKDPVQLMNTLWAVVR